MESQKLRRPHAAHAGICDNDRIGRAKAANGISHPFGTEFPIGSTMLDVRLHVLRGGFVRGEDFIKKLPIITARFDTPKQCIERFCDVTTKTQLERNAASHMSGINIDLNNFCVLWNEIGVEKIC